MTDVPKDWWQSFFRDVTVDMWLQAVPEEQTRREVDFIRFKWPVLDCDQENGVKHLEETGRWR